MTQLLPPKKEVALALLERSNVDIYLDPRARGVVVPPQFRKEPRLILKIGLNMPVPIPDLRLDEESMSCTLSFSRSPFYCVVPWTSVFAMVGDDGRGMVWPDDVPQELSVRAAEEQPSSPGGAGLSAVSDPSSSSSSTPSSGGKGKRRMAEATPDSNRSGGKGGKKKDGGGKKKKDEGRPMLMVLPSPPPSERRLDKAGDKAAEKPVDAKVGVREAAKLEARPEKGGLKAAPTSTRNVDADADAPKKDMPEKGLFDDLPKDGAKDADKPAPSQRPASAPGGRPKRELPPYLRVVK